MLPVPRYSFCISFQLVYPVDQPVINCIHNEVLNSCHISSRLPPSHTVPPQLIVMPWLRQSLSRSFFAPPHIWHLLEVSKEHIDSKTQVYQRIYYALNLVHLNFERHLGKNFFSRNFSLPKQVFMNLILRSNFFHMLSWDWKISDEWK